MIPATTGSCLTLLPQDMLMPPPSPPEDDTQDDSGFHSGGMSSSTSIEEQQEKTKRKAAMKTSKPTKRSESQPGRINHCESKEMMQKESRKQGRKPSDQLRISQTMVDPPHYCQYGHLPPQAVYAVPPSLVVLPQGRKGTVGKSYLSKLVRLPFIGARQQRNNNLPRPFGEEQGRSFYL